MGSGSVNANQKTYWGEMMKIGDIIECQEGCRGWSCLGRKVPKQYKKAEVIAVLTPPESDYRLFRVSPTEVVLIKLTVGLECGNCGAEMFPEEAVCPKCNYPVDAEEQEEYASDKHLLFLG